MNTIREADTIYFIEKGSIIEKGNHNHLMSLKGKYYNMINRE
jgi:ABC-type multidrug transport system fused ATPase/permease subunit